MVVLFLYRLIGRGSMFVLSTQQFLQLMGVNSTWTANSMLDLGAGDGMVTKQLAPLFSEVFCTETSPTMRWRLAERGYK